MQPEFKLNRAAMCALLSIERATRLPGWSEVNVVYRADTLLFVLSGDGNLLINGLGYPLRTGQAMLLKPRMSISIFAGNEKLEYYALRFRAFSWEDGLPSDGEDCIGELLPEGEIACSPFSQFVLALDMMYNHRHANGTLAALENQVRFQELLLLLGKQNTESASGSSLRMLVQQSIRYVEQHYAEPITVDQMSAQAGIGRSRYTELFKEVTGQTPHDYLNGVRIDKAQQLLLLTNDKLHSIAASVGFSNEYYFSRRFKQLVRMTPGQYRRHYQAATRVFAPFLEDFLVALGILPVAQCVQQEWGKQDYLNLPAAVPAFDIANHDWRQLSQFQPELIMLDCGYERWNLDKCHGIAPTFKLPSTDENWRATLFAIAAVFDKQDQAHAVVERYEQLVAKARARIHNTGVRPSVAVLRISEQGTFLYGDCSSGYTGPILYNDLGLAEPKLVRQLAHGQRRVSLTKEALSELDANHLFITFDKREGEGRELLQSKAWKQLPAVRNGCVYEVDFFAWMNYGVLSNMRKIEDVLRVLA